MRDYNRAASLFTHDGALRMPNIPAELVGQEEILAWAQRVPSLVDFLLQATHPGTIRLDGDGWKFTERAYEVRYRDTTPLTGSPAGAPGGAR
jgi:hypothetical protein